MAPLIWTMDSLWILVFVQHLFYAENFHVCSIIILQRLWFERAQIQISFEFDEHVRNCNAFLENINVHDLLAINRLLWPQHFHGRYFTFVSFEFSHQIRPFSLASTDKLYFFCLAPGTFVRAQFRMTNRYSYPTTTQWPQHLLPQLVKSAIFVVRSWVFGIVRRSSLPRL